MQLNLRRAASRAGLRETGLYATRRLFAVLLAPALILGLAAGLTFVTPVPSASATTGGAFIDSGDCTTHNLWRNDDGSTARVTLPFALNFYSHVYTSLFVNNNGNVTFQQAMSTYTPFTITASTPPIIAPFFADVDTRNSLSNVMTYGATTFNGHPAFCVSWKHVGYYASKIDKWNTFQLLLVNTSQQGDFDIVFNYGQIKWETGDASGGSDGLGGTPAGAGFSNGDGNPAHFVQLPGSLTSGAFLDGNTSTGLASHSNAGVPGRYIYHVASGVTIAQRQVCAPYYFISVAGSNEHPSSSTDITASPETLAVYNAYVAKHPAAASDTIFYQVPYTAAPVPPLVNAVEHFSTDVGAYFDSINDGANKLFAYVLNVKNQCDMQHKTPTFFLVGYSQGALILHGALQGGEGWLPPSQVGYVGLIADPAAVAGRQERINWGSSNTDVDYGFCRWAAHNLQFGNSPCAGFADDADIDSQYANKTESLCDIHDPVCSASTLGVAARWIWEGSGAVNNHTSYPSRDPDQLKTMGNSMATINHLS